MNQTTTQLHGVIRGKTIELDADINLPEGQPVRVTVQAASDKPKTAEEIRAVIDATAGACADEADELDEMLRETYELRRMDSEAVGE